MRKPIHQFLYEHSILLDIPSFIFDLQTSLFMLKTIY